MASASGSSGDQHHEGWLARHLRGRGTLLRAKSPRTPQGPGRKSCRHFSLQGGWGDVSARLPMNASVEFDERRGPWRHRLDRAPSAGPQHRSLVDRHSRARRSRNAAGTVALLAPPPAPGVRCCFRSVDMFAAARRPPAYSVRRSRCCKQRRTARSPGERPLAFSALHQGAVPALRGLHLG